MSGISYYPLRTIDKNQKVISATTDITLSATDSSGIYYCNNSSNIVITFSSATSNSMAIGSQIDFVRANANVTFNAAPSGITINSSSGGTPKIRVQWGACTLLKVTDTGWVVIGDIAT